MILRWKLCLEERYSSGCEISKGTPGLQFFKKSTASHETGSAQCSWLYDIVPTSTELQQDLIVLQVQNSHKKISGL